MQPLAWHSLPLYQLTLSSHSCSEQGAVAMEVDTSPEEAVSVALQASPEGEVRLQISPSQGPQGTRQGHASGPWATQQHHRGDLSFLDPVNMADCPPTVSACCSCICYPRCPIPACAGLLHARAGQHPSAACICGLGCPSCLSCRAASWLRELVVSSVPSANCHCWSGPVLRAPVLTCRLSGWQLESWCCASGRSSAGAPSATFALPACRRDA